MAEEKKKRIIAADTGEEVEAGSRKRTMTEAAIASAVLGS